MGPLTTPLTVTLRDYQTDAVAKVREAYKENRRVLFVLPTGGGKTVIFAYIVAAYAAAGKRVVVVAHRREICTQISEKLNDLGVEHDLVMPGERMKGLSIQVGMVQTLARRVEKPGKWGLEKPDLLVIDEAHHSAAGSWQKVMTAWPRIRVLGVTATPQRLDGKGLSDAFDELVIGPTMGWLIENRYLARYEYLAPPSALDLSEVRTRGGDFAVDDLEKAMAESRIVGDAVDHYGKYLAGKPAIAFCVTRKHAEQVADQFRAAGWVAAHIDGTMTSGQRKDLISDLASGRLNVLTSCEIISEGVDIPVCAGAILLRPTKSLGLWLQQVGRTLRLKSDGSGAVILDHVGNVHRFGMPCMDRDWTLDGRVKRKQASDVTTCSLCFKTFPKGSARSITVGCSGVGDTPCPFQDERESAKELPAEVDGELTRVTDIRPSDPMRPEWSRGIPLDKESTKGRRWFRLLELADTDEDKLEQIRKARGYKKPWVAHKIRERAETKAGVAAILTGSRDYNNDPQTWETATDAILWGVIRAVDDAESSSDGYPSFWPTVAEYARDEIQRRRRSVAA